MDTKITQITTTLCRTCLQQINNFSQCYFLENKVSNDDSITLRYKLSQCIPELDLDAIPGMMICNHCFIAVNFIDNFKNKCLQTEKKIKTLGGMSSSAAFVETPLEIVHSGLLNEKPQPVNIKVENTTDITEETSLHFENIPNNEITDPQIQNIKTENYQREVTLYESPQQTNLQIQSNASTPSEPSTSHMLNYTITNQNNLNQPNTEINHGLVYYGSNVWHQCNICDLLFVSNVSLASHLILCKFNQRLNGDCLFKCSKCNFACKYKSILTYHENLPHINGIAVDDKGPYKCHICTKEVFFLHNLKHHMQFHTPNNLRKCDKCN